MKKFFLSKPFLHKLMRISFYQILIIALFSTMGLAHTTKGQDVLNKKITLNYQSVELKKVLQTIESQLNVKFVYSNNLIKANQKISAAFVDTKLQTVLNNILYTNGMAYEVYDNRIILKLKTSEKLTSVAIQSTESKSESIEEPIKGKVTDSKNESLPGVSIAIKGTKKGVTTNSNGDYEINANKGDVLIFSFIGFKNQEITIGDATVYNVSLEESTSSLNEVVVVGSRFGKPRTDVDRPVAIDVINAKELQTSGQVDLGQAITFTAPSFTAVKFGINDGAPFVDPATLRGLGPDQVLMLVNNKRRHKVSFLSINDGVGKGQVGTDINVIPALSLKRVEILRDGAAAQYGSDAIAGVINMELNDASSGGTVNVYTGIGYSKPNLDVKGIKAPVLTTDGLTYNINANVGLKLTSKGYINTTLSYGYTNGYDRSGTYSSSNGFFVKDPIQDAVLIKQNNIDLDRAKLGSAENTTYGIFSNMGIKINQNWKWYAFGGYTNKNVITNVFTRPPTNKARTVLSKFPNGYNPIAPATLQDFSIVTGMKGKLGTWNSDFSLSQGGNKVDWYAENTVNPSLGDASPTEFYVGQTKNSQTLVNVDLSKTYHEGSYPNFSVGVGSEFRLESFAQKAGDPASYQIGPLAGAGGGRDVGSSGREGFSNKTAISKNRNNLGVYLEAESDITKSFLLGGAIRVENYSDFGSNVAYKLNTRLKIADPFSIRGSVSRGFRAPSMTQAYYSNFANVSFDNAGNSIINPVIPATSELAKLVGVNGLQQETSLDYSVGVTSKIGKHLTLTADVYQIDVDNRILLSGSINVSKIPQFVAAGFPQTANVFSNAIDTRTKGLEIVGTYNTAIGAKVNLGINAAYSSMNTSLRGTRTSETGVVLADKIQTTYLTKGLPKDKFIASVNLDISKISVMFRLSKFGTVTDPKASYLVAPTDPNIPNYQVFSAKTLADFALTYRPTSKLSAVLGMNNIFDVYPDLLEKTQLNNEVVFSRTTNQFGTQGRFVNLTLNYNF